MVGAITVLATLVALFLAYNANQGLPFVPTRVLKVNIADGSNLVVGNDVREGGFRIGLLSAVRPVGLGSGRVGAQLTLKLDRVNGRVPVDSRVTVLSRSVLGLKFVDLEKGSSSRVIADGGTLPISRTYVPVQFDDVFKTFDARTRRAVQLSLVGVGGTLAGRGGDLNVTIRSLPSLLGRLESVAGFLSDRRTGLVRFFDALNGFVGALAPVAGVNARLFGDMATTFGAIARDPGSLEQTIARSPATLSVSTDSLRAQTPFLRDFAVLGRYLAPATGSLRVALPVINPALEEGTRVLARTPVLDRGLQRVMAALRSLALAPGTNVAVSGLARTVATLNPMIRYLGPFVTVCNYWNYWFGNFADHISQPTTYGSAQRALLNIAGLPASNTAVGGQVGAVAPANGTDGSDTGPLSGLIGGREFAHSQPYGAAVDNQGNADCEAGQRGYVKRLNYFDPQRRNLGTDIHNPGNQGTTWTGRLRVPRGETFSRAPLTGPQLTPNPANP